MAQVVILCYFAKNRRMFGFFFNGEIWISDCSDFHPIFSKFFKKLPNHFLNSGYVVKEGLIAKFGA
jgi:hypothetical protein